MPRKRLLSDLVQDSKIETTITVNYTEHVFYSTGHTARDRLVRRTERWSRDGPSAFLGQGAYGTVYRECCGRKLRAVKEVKKYIVVGEELDYTRELEAIVKFSNPRYAYCFVRSHGWFEHGDSVFITMEYLPHGDLQKFLTRPLPEIEARQITSQVLDGLSHMHKNGFVHRDLKPANIMVVTKATDWYVKIADFGISKRRQEGVTTLRTIQQGTLGYAAPEAIGIGGDGNERSYTLAVDMWSLGAVAYKMLTNEALFQNLNDLFRYTSGLLEFPASVLESYNITAEGKDFISSLVSPEPEMRPSSTSTSPHTWIIMTLASDRICGVDDR
ncbi:protein kinase-like domain-containing protein [Xylariomycetidae sp. FL2044]|nr:protein kinase-like domain-containing protein [Xylariomycetidae sp. FL2044]